MKTAELDQIEFSNLRERAVKIVEKEPLDFSSYSAQDLPHLARQLAVQQVMLKLQNEQLRQTRAELDLNQPDNPDFFTAVFNTPGALIIVMDPQGHIVRFNQACEALSGYRADEVQDRLFWDVLLLPEDRARKKASFRKLGSGQLSDTNECYWAHRNGSRRLVSWSNTALLDHQQQVRYVIGIGVDITQRKLAAAALRDSEELHRVTISSISDAVFITDDAGQFTYICPNVQKIFGYSVENVEQMETIYSLLGRNIFDPARLETAGEIENIERIVKDKTGLHHVLLVNVKRVSIRNGTILYTCHDITDRKQSEMELNRLLEAVSVQREQLRALTGKLAEAQEMERKALARELHDQVGQKLTSLNLNLNTLHARLSKPVPAATPVLSIVEHSLRLVEETAESIQDVMVNLRPPVLDDYGLMAALQWYGTALAQDVDFVIRVFGEEPAPRLPASTEHALYRITQEALTNVIKHSQASQVTIHLEENSGVVRLTITDDGLGFDPVQRLKLGGRSGWGLFTMIERAETVGGSCQVKSRAGQGTQIIVEIPR